MDQVELILEQIFYSDIRLDYIMYLDQGSYTLLHEMPSNPKG